MLLYILSLVFPDLEGPQAASLKFFVLISSDFIAPGREWDELQWNSREDWAGFLVFRNSPAWSCPSQKPGLDSPVLSYLGGPAQPQMP